MDFIGRNTLLDQIDKKISVPGSWVAFVGIGGVGLVQPSQYECVELTNQKEITACDRILLSSSCEITGNLGSLDSRE